jgi:hypothetical protein
MNGPAVNYEGEYDGGAYVWMINKTGAPSIKGTIAHVSPTTDDAFSLTGHQSDAIGVVFDDGVPDGERCRLVVAGKAQVLFEDGCTPVRGQWLRPSATVSRGLCIELMPGGIIIPVAEHFKEVGHVIESKPAGTNVLAKCIIHFN